jgi:NDP-sugar pyrophosphorylase family protein
VVDGLSGAIIAAGRGERLRDAVHGVPKPLVEIGGETLLVRQARAIASVGATPVHVIVNSETAGMLRDRRVAPGRNTAREGELGNDSEVAHDHGIADDGERKHDRSSTQDRERVLENRELADDRGVALPPEVRLYVRDTANSMESLLTLGEHIAPGRFLMTTVDAILSRSELARFAQRALELTDPRNPDALDGALGVVRWRGDKRPLFAKVADGVILALGDGEAPQVTAGLYLFSTRIFELAEEARAVGLDAMRQYLALLIRRGMRFAAIDLNDVIDVDEAADLDAARALVSNPGGGS